MPPIYESNEPSSTGPAHAGHPPPTVCAGDDIPSALPRRRPSQPLLTGGTEPEGAGFEFVGEGYRLDEGIGIAVRREDDSLLSRLNSALKVILANGTYERINARYFPFSIF